MKPFNLEAFKAGKQTLSKYLTAFLIAVGFYLFIRAVYVGAYILRTLIRE